jgi:hypothetical protein
MPDMRTNLYKDNSGIIVSSSIFDSYVSGDFDADVYGDYDAWIFRMSDVWTSSSELNNTDNLHIYPNPAHNIVHIDVPNNKPTKLNIYSIAGKLLISKQKCGSFVSLNINSFNKGVYIVEIIQDDWVVREQLVVY